MKKHPNSPAINKPKRAKADPVGLEEYDKIHELWEERFNKKEIAEKMLRSTGTIAHVIIHLTREEVVRRQNRHSNLPEHYNIHESEERDLSKLPDTTLFQHSKEYLI